MYFQDGYRLIRAEQLIGALHAWNEREISFRAFRTYIGCFELLAIREAAERSNPLRGKKQHRRFLRSELEELIDAEEGSSLSRELSALKAAGLLSFTESAIEVTENAARSIELLCMLGSRGGRRLIPVPRQVLKFLAACTRPALAKTVVAYLLRGLSLERSGEIRSAGTVKVSWICELCQISERAVRAARAELIQLGWITKDTGSFQRKLNRDGAYFVINPAWRRVLSRPKNASPSVESPSSIRPARATLADREPPPGAQERRTGSHLSDALKQFAPLGAKNCPGSAPPNEKLETPNGSKNQKAPAVRLRLPPNTRTASETASATTGVCKANGGREGKKPNLRDIKPDDLRYLSRLKQLYTQAVAAKWLQPSEANLRNFIAAAARSTRVKGDAVRIFVGIVKRGLWHHLTGEDEARAVLALKRADLRRDDAQHMKTSGPISEMVQGLLLQLGGL